MGSKLLAEGWDPGLGLGLGKYFYLFSETNLSGTTYDPITIEQEELILGTLLFLTIFGAYWFS